MKIAIDLDDTLITSSHNWRWEFKKGSVEVLLKLRDKGYLFYIVTARPDIPGNRTRLGHVVEALLEKGIIILQYVFTSRSPKGVFARNLGCVYMIDDHEVYLSDCRENGVIPIQLLPGKQHPSRKEYLIAYSWEDIYCLLP